MTALKKYNIEGKEVGEIEVDPSFTEVSANSQMVKDYLTALRANARQWSANTKGRSFSTRKKVKTLKKKTI